MNYKIFIEYDGLFFSGWQANQKDKSIQHILEDAFSVVLREKISLFCAGRTDKGVHASCQVASFKVEKNTIIDPSSLIYSVNGVIKGKPIAVFKIEEVDDDFNARFSAVKRHYIYQIFNRNSPPAIYKNYFWHVARSLDVEAMKEGISYLIGLHDFNAFCAFSLDTKRTIRTLEVGEIEKDKEKIYIKFSAKSFLYKQVRIMVGTLCGVGLHVIKPSYIKDIISSKDRKKAGITAPPHGLYFVGADY